MKIFYNSDSDLWAGNFEALRDFYYASFTKEAWFRSLLQANEEEKLCDLLNADPSSELIPGARPGQDIFSYVFEHLINEKGLKADSLNDFSNISEEYSADYFGASLPYCLEPYFFSQYEEYFSFRNSPLIVQNLFGDGGKSYVYFVYIGFSDRRMAIYATHQVDGKVQLVRMRDWERFNALGWWYDIEFFDIGDQNRDGRAEFVVVVEYLAKGSGIWQWQTDWLEWYEWNPEQGEFETAKVTVFDQAAYDLTLWREWKFTNESRIPLLTVDDFSYYPNDSDDGYLYAENNCKYFFSQQVYRLVNGYFYPIDSTPSLPGNSPICQIVWAYRVVVKPQGWKNDQAIGILSNALINWPDEMNKLWGDASRDYLQLRMAVWRDFRGEKQSAIELLGALKGKNEQALPSKMAGSYLEDRQQKGIMAACAALNDAKYQAVGDGVPTGLAPIWGYATDNPVGNSLRIDDFCDRADVVVVSAATTDVQNEDELRNWLLANGKQSIYTKELSINGRTIWLAGFLDRTFEQIVDQKSQTVYVYHLWAFTPAGNGLNALFVDAWRSYDELANPDEANISFNLLQPASNTYLLGVFSKYRLDVVRVYPEGRLSVQLPGLDRTADFYFHNDRIEMLTKERYPEAQWRLTAYVWNDSIQNFEISDKPGYDFTVEQREAEHLIYREKDYVGAIILINKFLLEALPDQVIPSFCYDGIEAKNHFLNCDLPPALYRPYLRYLLGVAYEMAGQPDMGKLTFYALWNEYPTNIFGIAASQRLAPIQP